MTNVTLELHIVSDICIIDKLRIMTHEIETQWMGKMQFNAPDGQHDDIVISMALAVSRIRDSKVNIEELIL